MLKFSINNTFIISPADEFTVREIVNHANKIILLDYIPESRTVRQNKYYWVCIGLLAEHLGYTKEEMSILFKDHIKLYEEFANRETGEVMKCYKSTTNLNKKEFSELTESLLQFAAEQGVVIQTPSEYYGLEGFETF